MVAVASLSMTHLKVTLPEGWTHHHPQLHHEEGVTIGYYGTQSEIGSIAGRMQGTVENCVSYATVKGVNYVGGIIGTRDNAMGICTVNNCTFGGTVEATGSYVGGIMGGGYGVNSSAPNGIRTTVTDCKVTDTASVTGQENVGGIKE